MDGRQSLYAWRAGGVARPLYLYKDTTSRNWVTDGAAPV